MVFPVPLAPKKSMHTPTKQVSEGHEGWKGKGVGYACSISDTIFQALRFAALLKDFKIVDRVDDQLFLF